MSFLMSAQAQTVSIPDAGLDAAIRAVLQKPIGPLTVPDMLGLTNLNATNRNIRSIEGLETARNLSVLQLNNNALTNFALPNTLTNLGVLDLSSNPLSQCTIPGGLTNLGKLTIESCLLTSFTLPANLTGLTALDLNNNHLTTFTLPAGLPNLTLLDLGFNSLTQCSIPVGTTEHRLAIRRSCEQMFLSRHWKEMMAAYKRQLRRSKRSERLILLPRAFRSTKAPVRQRIVLHIRIAAEMLEHPVV